MTLWIQASAPFDDVGGAALLVPGLAPSSARPRRPGARVGETTDSARARSPSAAVA